jgi:methyl-accepting chemotaxis protein
MPARTSGRSINRRLTRTVFFAAASSLLLTCAVIVVYDWITFRQSMTERAETLAEVVAIESAVALSFLDPMSAAQTLSALSAAEPVIAAVVYDGSGAEFARFAREEADFVVPPAGRPGHEFGADHLDLRRPIVFDASEIGTIFIRWDTRELTSRTVSILGLVALLLVALLGVAALISSWLRRRVSKPLAELVEGSEAIAGGDLSTSVKAVSGDEIGVLGRTFNAMAQGLRGLVSQVDRGTRDVTDASGRLEESARSLSREARRQAVAITDASEAVDQVAGSSHDVNESVSHLEESMRETSASITQMQASVTEVAGHMDHLAQSIETTSAAVNQVAGNTDEVVSGVETLMGATNDSLSRLDLLKRSVDLVKNNAQASHALSDDTSQEASRGLAAVNETMASMREISASFHELEQSISRLAENSASIDEILKVIRAVADRTSMLSLNASIIAAQAGEHGAAFSVVADEVNNLAQGTHRSTQEIEQLIRAVQEDTAAAVAAAEEGAAKLGKGVRRSNEAGDVLKVISEKSQNSTERVHEILEAASRQIEDLLRVDQAVNEVTRIVERFGHSARDQQSATSEIAESVEKIRLLGLDVRRSMDEQRRGGGLITSAVSNVSNLIGQIAEATQSQTKSSENIQNALQIFRDATSETERRVEAINEMVAMLSERAGRLEQEIGRFRTE